MKKGPPRSAVMTPTGSSAGARMVLAKVSQSARNAPPKRQDAGAR